MPEKAFVQTQAGMVRALEFIEEILAGGEKDVTDRAVLVAGEVLANAVEHGGERADLTIRVGVEWRDQQLVLHIREPESGVDLRRLGSAELPADILAMSGRGLFLIRTLADDVRPDGDLGIRYSFRMRIES